MRKIIFGSIFFIFTASALYAQEKSGSDYKLHSHNDYLQAFPFWEAYVNRMESIEADVILIGNELYVAHEEASVIAGRTLTSLYLDPIRTAFALKLGGVQQIQLLIDIKTEPYSTMQRLEEVLSSYKDILTEKHGSSTLGIVISGNRPNPEDYRSYPDYIKFDYQSVKDTLNLPLDKIALISLNFKKLSSWSGEGLIDPREEKRLKEAISIAHALQRPIRFWATPDDENSWRTLHALGVDYINTDQPYKARSFINFHKD